MSRGRFELPTQGFSVLCSNRLSYLDMRSKNLTLELKTKIQADIVSAFYGHKKKVKKVNFGPLFF